MATYIISDTHFNHNNIISLCRPQFTNIEEMNNYIIKQWNKTVNNNDTVYFLGDFCLGANKQENIVKFGNLLKGNKHIILGNHDLKDASIYIKAGFKSISRKPIILYNKYILSHFPFEQECKDFIYYYGHLHDKFHAFGINACVDVNEYKPIKVEEK